MAWTVPRTWVPGELVTASMMNTQIRDNLTYLFSARGSCMLYASSLLFAPVDSTTYYAGHPQTSSVQTAADLSRVYVPATGTINAAYLSIVVEGTIGSTETSSAWIRKNNTSDTLISSSVQANQAAQYYSLVPNLSVTAGDSLQLKWTTPAWATNPTNVRMALQLALQASG